MGDPDATGGELSTQANVTILQLVNVSFLMVLINVFIIHAARRHFTQDPKAQEVVYKALFTVLMFGDFAHYWRHFICDGTDEVGSWKLERINVGHYSRWRFLAGPPGAVAPRRR